MTVLETQGISLHYETHGDPASPPVLLISGLGGVGASWGSQTARFAEGHFVILPDQRGTGRTSRTLEGHTTQQLAQDMVALIETSGSARCMSWAHRRAARSRSTSRWSIHCLCIP